MPSSIQSQSAFNLVWDSASRCRSLFSTNAIIFGFFVQTGIRFPLARITHLFMVEPPRRHSQLHM
ncbi:MAG TPA: hypothetical protein VNG29_03740, partial [Candidatus Paceibacterota bacterium]|nr:hypothetical protein [Candidatus Paceibacterota bacterium]